MALTTLGTGLDLADNLIKLITPTVTQVQKESLLNAFKSRVSKIQAAGDAIAQAPTDRNAQLALGSLTRELCNAAGFTAPGLAGFTDNVPLDDYLQLLTIVALFVEVMEQTTGEKSE